MKILRSALLASLFFSSTSHAICYSKQFTYSFELGKQTSARYTPTYYTTSYDALPRQERKKFALEMIKQVELIRSHIPRLSPRELEWLQNEENISLQRKLKTWDSKEYARKNAHGWLDWHFETLKRIAEKDESERQEVLLWTFLARDVGDPNYRTAMTQLYDKHKMLPPSVLGLPSRYQSHAKKIMLKTKSILNGLT